MARTKLEYWVAWLDCLAVEPMTFWHPSGLRSGEFLKLLESIAH